MKKNISFDYGYRSDYTSRIAMITNAGFDGVLIYADERLPEYIESLSQSTLIIEALHLPYKTANALWTLDSIAETYMKQLAEGIYMAASHHVGKVVIHVTSGYHPPEFNQTGIDRLLWLTDLCRSFGIHLCLENLKRVDYLHLIFEKIPDTTLKFCFDSGHANAFTRNIDTFPWNLLKDRLDCVHLHDNNGSDDQHLLPFDGNIKWAQVMTGLYQCHPDLKLTLELHEQAREKYGLAEIEFLNIAYKRVLELESLINFEHGYKHI